MSVGVTNAGRGSFGIVETNKSASTRHRQLVDIDRADETTKAALEADSFIIYGKASVEQYDEDQPSQKILMSAFEDEIDNFLTDGIISRRHKDIPVGKPLRSYTLNGPSEMTVDDETYTYEEGDTLRTEVKDDEVWIVADVFNNSEIARETREGVLNGDLDGFSVTVFCKSWEETSKGQEVTDIDWHSTTIGGEEHIKNKKSRFGVAEYKALFDDDDYPVRAKQAALEILRELPNNMSTNRQGGTAKGFWDRVSEIASQKAEEEYADEDYEEEEHDDEAASMMAAVMDEMEEDYEEEPEEEPEMSMAEDEESMPPELEEELEEEEAKGDDYEEEDYEEEEMKEDYEDEEHEDEESKAADVAAILKQVSDEIGEEQAMTLEDAMEAEEDEEEMDSEAEMGELKAFTSKLESLGFVRDKSYDPDEFATKADIDKVIAAAENVVTKAVAGAARDAASLTAEKMVTGDTPSPSAGPANDGRDYRSEIKQRYASQRSK